MSKEIVLSKGKVSLVDDEDFERLSKNKWYCSYYGYAVRTQRTKIAIPKIGCGLAGGDWNIVEQLINDTVGDDLEIWVYEL